MPHCVLEYSDNILEKSEIRNVLKSINELLDKSEQFRLSDIKSRAICYETVYLGDGSPERAFVNLKVSILSGRNLIIRKELSTKLHDLLIEKFSSSTQNTKCSLTVEIKEIDTETYSKAD
jgi:5-carboxymethyl-2-hydroxymuconate isomerase